jgi:hypothetical protein
MTIVLSSHGVTFRPFLYENEKTFEADVVTLADHIFGPASLYLDIKKKMGNDIVTIPDGYVLDATEPDQPRLFVVENEIVSHDPFRHVGIRLLKFVTSFDKAKRAIRMFLMNSIQRDDKLLKRLNEACKKSSSPNVDNYLDRAVYSDFKGLVVIDRLALNSTASGKKSTQISLYWNSRPSSRIVAIRCLPLILCTMNLRMLKKQNFL